MMHQLKEDSGYNGHNKHVTSLSFTIREEHVRLLNDANKDIEARFAVTVTVEKTTYAQSDFVNVRWVHLEGRDDQLMKCAKAYIEALCSPEHQQPFEYPPALHEDIAGKKPGLEHGHGYKAVIRFQQEGMMIVSGQIDAVLMVVSFFEHEINQWKLRLQDEIYEDQVKQVPNSKQSDHGLQQDQYLQSDYASEDQLDSLTGINQSPLVYADSGRNAFPDILPQTTQRTHSPHTVTTAPNTAYGMDRQATHSSRETPWLYLRKPGRTSPDLHQDGYNAQSGYGKTGRISPGHQKYNSNTGFGNKDRTSPYHKDGHNTSTGYGKSGFDNQSPVGQSAYGTSAHVSPQNQGKANNYQWVERNLPREDTTVRNLPLEDPSYQKQVHICTPPQSVIDPKRQRTVISKPEGNLVTDCVAISNSDSSSSFGSSELNSRRLNTGSFKSGSVYASSAAQRQGYSDQEVEGALKELPPDFKTSDLIRTLSRRRRNSSTHPNGTSSQPYHTDRSRSPARSSSPLSDPGHSVTKNTPSQEKPLSSSQPLPLTSLSQNTPGSVKRDQWPRHNVGISSSNSMKIDTLRRKQQELMASLGSQPIGRPPDPIGRLDFDSPPGEDKFAPNNSSQTFSTQKDISIIDDRSRDRPQTQDRNELRPDDVEDVMVLSDEQDMEFAIALESAERMDIDQDVQYVHTKFPEGAEYPDVLLVSPPIKPDPELVILDEEVQMVGSKVQESSSCEILHTTKAKPASTKNTKRLLAPTFSNSPQVFDIYSEDPKVSASMPAMSKPVSFRTSEPRYMENNQFKTIGYSRIEEKPRDEADSPPRTPSPLESKMQIGMDSQQGKFRARTSSPFSDKGGQFHDLSAVKQEPLHEYSAEDEYKANVALIFGSENMETDEEEEPISPKDKKENNATARPFAHLKLETKDPKLVQSTDSDEEQLHASGKTLHKSHNLPGFKKELLDESDPSDPDPEVQEVGVMELLKNFQADFESQKEDFERKIKERTLKETLDMVAEQNEAMQRQMNQKQKESSGGKESVTGQDIDEKLRAERKKMNEKQKKVVQKLGQQFSDFKEKVLKESEEKLQEQYKELMQQQRDELQQQQIQEQQRLLQEQQETFKKELQKMQKKMQEEMRKQQETMQETMRHQMEQQKQSRPVAGAGAVPVEKDVIVIKPSQKGTPSPYRPIVIDGSNVAMLHGKRDSTFSCRGIALCVQYFQNRGIEDITVFVPRWRKTQNAARFDRPIKDQDILDKLENKGILSFTPGRKVQGRYINSYDDRFIVRLATENGGIIVSNDNFRDLMQESEEWKEVIETRLLMFTFAGDQFMIPDDPYGRDGPTLQQLLLKPKPDITQRMPTVVGTQTAIRQQEPPGLNEHQLQQLTHNIGMEWERLGTYLRFSHTEIVKIKRDHPHHTDGAIKHMLKTWNGRQRNKPNHMDALAEALRHAGRADLGEMVLRWKQERQQGGSNKGKGHGGGGIVWGGQDGGPPQGQAGGGGVWGQGGGPPQGQPGGGGVWGQGGGPPQGQPGGGGVWGQGGGPPQGQPGGGVGVWGQGGGPPQGQLGILGQPLGPGGLLGAFPQQAFGGRPSQKAPATQSTPPPEVDVKKLPQYQNLKEMFPEKEVEIQRLLKENPKSDENYLVDKLLMC